MEVKSVIIAKDGIAKIGNDIIHLADQSYNTFKTKCLYAFIAFITSLEAVVVAGDDAKEKMAIFYSNCTITLKWLAAKFNQKAIAICELATHPIMDRVREKNEKELTIKELDDFLFLMRGYYSGTAAKDLYDKLQKFSVKKVTNLYREKDRAGNFVYTCERKDAEGALEFPTTISFQVPIFDKLPGLCVTVVFDLYINYRENEGDVEITFTLKNPLLEDDLREQARVQIEHVLEDVKKIDKFFGELDLIEKTDSWKYQINKI